MVDSNSFTAIARAFRDAVAQIDFSALPGVYDTIPWQQMDEALDATGRKPKGEYLAIHHHRHGVDVYPFRAEQEPDEGAVVEACGINFEPERDEYIDITWVDLSNIPSIQTASTETAPSAPTETEENTFALVTWAASDVLTLRPDWTREQAEEFLNENEKRVTEAMMSFSTRTEKRVTEAMIQCGWSAIEDLLD